MEIFCPKQYVKDFNNKLDNEIQAMYYTNTERDHIYIDNTQRKKRSLNSIACSSNIKEYLLNDIHNFIKSENAYVQRGINYKRNYLLYGPPGTGKTSLIFSLASELDRDIKIIDGSTICNIDSFRKTLINTPIRTIIVIEDIDALSNKLFNRDDKYPVTVDKSSTTLSDILNYFDGLRTPQGLICFFTTNYIDRLDSAFVRDGRMDVKIKIEHAEKADVIDGMIRHFVGEHELIKIEKSMPTGRYDTSKLQSFLMDYYNKTLEGNNNEVLKELIKNIKKCNLK
jgi:chaperone BCS1